MTTLYRRSLADIHIINDMPFSFWLRESKSTFVRMWKSVIYDIKHDAWDLRTWINALFIYPIMCVFLPWFHPYIIKKHCLKTFEKSKEIPIHNARNKEIYLALIKEKEDGK